MWFLLLEIFLLLLLTALFASWLTHWWLKRDYEEVTDQYNSLVRKADNSTQGLLTKSDFVSGLADLGGPDLSPVETRLGALENAINTIRLPETDLSPVEQRLIGLERTIQQLRFPKTDMGPIETRLSSLEDMLSNPQANMSAFNTRFSRIESSLTALHSTASDLQNTDTSRLERQMDLLATAFADRRETDLTQVEARLGGVEDAVSAIALPETDLGPIHSGLTRVEMSLSNMDTQAPDLSAVETRIHALQEIVADYRTRDTNDREVLLSRINEVSAKLAEMHNTDLTPLDQRLDDIETRIAHIQLPEMDMRPVDEGLSIIHGRLASLEAGISDAGRQTVDLAPLQMRIDQMQSEIMRLERMEGSIATLRMDVQQSTTDLSPLHQRMEMLQRDIANQPSPDLTPVVNSVYAMEQRMDFAAMENRLTSIEYGLAALHHMLRSRSGQETNTRAPEASAATPPPPVFTAPPAPQVDTYSDPQPSNYTPRPPRDSWQTREPREREPRERESRNYSYDYEPAPQRRPAKVQSDSLSEARRPDDKANLLTRPAFGAPDDLEEISGVGPMLHGLLTEIGVYYFWQVAEWGPDEIEWVDDMLDGFNGRIDRDDWVGQAKILATGANAAKRP